MPTGTQLATTLLLAVLTIIVSNVLGQVLFRDRRKPPVVFHVFPGIGSTVAYGQDPYAFFFACREKVCVLFFFRKGCEFVSRLRGLCRAYLCRTGEDGRDAPGVILVDDDDAGASLRILSCVQLHLAHGPDQLIVVITH